MPPLLPSEVARLVYGQLIRCNCSTMAEEFLNESPHLEECREFVNQVGKPSFIVKAYGLSLQQILERYLEMWNLILERTNSVIPDTCEKFADPVEALKFLLTAYNHQTADEVGNLPILSDEMRWKTIYNGTSSNFSSRVSPTVDVAQGLRRNHLHDMNRVFADTTESNSIRGVISEDFMRQNCAPLKLKKPNSYLDKLYASTESLGNPGSKKRLKVLKPRQSALNRPSTTYSAPRKAASNPNLSKDNFRLEDNSSYNAEACVQSEKDWETTATSRTKSPDHIKKTNMQLRSSSKVPDKITQQESDDKNLKVSKKRKYSCSPEQENVVVKQSKLCKSTFGKENDAQVDFTKIPQLLIEDPKLPELIAENINKRILESPQKKIDTLAEDQDNVIKSIAEKTLKDQLMDDIIYELLKCGQNIAQEKHSAVPDISLLDANPYDTNIDGEDYPITHEISENADVLDKLPGIPECTGKSEQIFANTDYSRLHEDMNEFVQFNKPKDNNVVSSDQSGIIVIQVPETDQHSSNLVIENQICSAHSNFVVCSTDESLVTNGKELQDDIITLCTESNGVKWNVPTTSSVIVTAATPTNTNTKLQICGPVTSPTKMTKRNYRPIAPKPNSVVSKSSNSTLVVSKETNSHHNKSKSLKRTKK